MRGLGIMVLAVALAGTVVACGEDDEAPGGSGGFGAGGSGGSGDTGGSGGSGGTGGTGGSGGSGGTGGSGGSGGTGGSGGSGGTGGTGGSGEPGYAADVKPILAAHCVPCHTSLGSGGVNHAASYEDTQKDSNVCTGKKVYECILIRIQDGSMPRESGCTGDPAQDAGKPNCLTAAEQDTVAAWVAAGAPP